MKKSNFYPVIAILLFTCSFSYGQIKVDTDGDVTIGATTDATYDLDVVGDTYISGKLGVGYAPDATYKFQTSSAKFWGDVFFYNNSYPTFEVTTGYYNRVLRPTQDGTCTIGTSSYKFEYVYADDGSWSSDIRIKENIRSVDDGLELIKKLNPIKYDVKEDRVFLQNVEYSAKEIERKEKLRKDHYGFSAQEIEEILPELVTYGDSTDTYGIEYIQLIPILTKAIQEQQLVIENLQSEISSLKSNSLKSLSTAMTEDNFSTTECALFQNNPNPFGENTHIGYNLPDRFSNANIVIYDMTGKQLRDIQLHDSGESSIEISAYEMDPGMYMYSMIVDNQLIDTKQMVLTK